MAHIDLNGQRFELRPEPPKEGMLMVVARAEKRGGNYAAAAYLDLLESLLSDHDADEFERAVAQMDGDAIGEALEAAAKTYNVDPSLPAQRSSTPSSSGQPTGGPTSKVVSFSKGTVQVAEAS
jgi:hypothetical protein